MPLPPQWQKRAERRMEAEEAIEIEHRPAWNVDARAHSVILRFAVGNHDVQTIRRTALEDHDQALIAHPSVDSTEPGASEKAGNRSRSHDGEPTVPYEYATRNCHKIAAEPECTK